MAAECSKMEKTIQNAVDAVLSAWIILGAYVAIVAIFAVRLCAIAVKNVMGLKK